MIPRKRRPALGSPSTVSRTQAPDVPTHCARRHGQSQFEEEFVRDPFFTPGRVRLGHAHDESLQLPRNRRPSCPRLPAPEEPPALTMPPDERVWLAHRQERAPVEQAGEQDKNHSRGRIRPSRFDAALLVECQLLAQEQVLRRQLRARRHRKAGQRADIDPIGGGWWRAMNGDGATWVPVCGRADFSTVLCQKDTCRASSRRTGCSICGSQGRDVGAVKHAIAS